MSKAELIVRFDYSVLDKDDKGKLEYLVREIKKASTQHKKAGIEIGESISKAHAILATGGKEGQFSAWVESECGFSRATAYNYMNAWETFGDCDVIDQFDNGALYVLAGANVPEEAVKEAVKSAKKGYHFTTEKAKEHLGKFRDLVKKTAPNKQVKGPIVQPLDNSNKSQASVSGSDEPTPLNAPPCLPSVGTVNRTDSGSQGDGDAGECLEVDYGRCPNCAGTKWTEDELGVSCSKCRHPHGEPAGDVDAQRIADARSKTIKTAEALMRAFDDLNLLASHPKEHANAIVTCKILLKTARDWK